MLSNIGRKRIRNEPAWKRNIAKSLKNKGLEYESSTGKKVLAKTFIEVKSCCPRKCFEKVDCEWQKSIFEKYWNCGDMQVQNTLLENMMEKKEVTKELKCLQWQYHCRYKGTSIVICRKFICSLFQIGERKIKVVQEKIISGDTMADKRGRHENHNVKLTENLKTLILAHCKSLPHSESHYSREDSKLNYFQDKSLTLQSLYNLFLNYYASVTGDKNIPIDKTTYFNYFNHHVNFSIGMPRTDVCDLCYTYETNKGRESEYQQHLIRVEKYRKLKTSMMSTATLRENRDVTVTIHHG